MIKEVFILSKLAVIGIKYIRELIYQMFNGTLDCQEVIYL